MSEKVKELIEKEINRLEHSSGRSGHWDDPTNREIRELEELKEKQ